MFDSPSGGESQSRRLPIYLLLDTSGSMSGANIQAVNVGVRMLYDELMKDPMAIETVFISLITFDSEVKQLMPLTPITQFTPPQLKAYGGTSLGGALKMLNDKLDTEVISNAPDRKGDYKPLIFLMTDGRPTDTWEPAANTIRSRPKQKVATIIALGCGGAGVVDENILRRVADHVLLMENVSADQITQFFKWVSQSVSTASKSAQMAAGDQEAVAELSAPPEGIKIII